MKSNNHTPWYLANRAENLRAHAKSPQSCLTLCNPMDRSPTGFSVHGILQARILEQVAMPSSRESSQPRIKPTSLTSPAVAGGFFTTSATWEAHKLRPFP